MNKEIKKIRLHELKTIDTYKTKAIIEGEFPSYNDVKEFGRVRNSKDSLLFCLEEIFDKEIPKSTRNFELVYLLGKEYKYCDINSIIDYIPNTTFDMIGQLYNFCVRNKDAIGVTDKLYFDIVEYYDRFLFDMGMVYEIEKNINRFFLFNIDAIMSVGKIFENVKEYVDIIEEHKDFEDIVRGLLYTYGILETDFALEQVNKFLKTKYTKDEFYEKIYSNLALNELFNPINYSVNFSATKECKKHTKEFECICLDDYRYKDFNMYAFIERRLQQNLNYKCFTKEEIACRNNYVIKNHEYQLLFDLFGEKRFNENLLNRMVADHMYYCRINPDDLKYFVYWLKSGKELEDATELLMNYLNSIPQFAFGGYCPNEMFNKLYGSEPKIYSEWKPKK